MFRTELGVFYVRVYRVYSYSVPTAGVFRTYFGILYFRYRAFRTRALLSRANNYFAPALIRRIAVGYLRTY